MNSKSLGVLGIFILLIGVIVGAAVYFSKSLNKTPGLNVNKSIVRQAELKEKVEAEQPKSAVEQELEELSSQMVSDFHAERRVNVNMVGQLRAYRRMLTQIQDYAQAVEKQIDIIEEIGKDEFQEDVKLQASLFAGKKSDLVAKHLKEFKASRVGAILSKMKEKEASAVLDTWAKKDDPRVSAFYRETMAAYLNNKRRDMHPELFDKGVAGSDARKQDTPR